MSAAVRERRKELDHLVQATDAEAGQDAQHGQTPCRLRGHRWRQQEPQRQRNKRNGTHALELASMIAASERKVLDLSHLQDAWAQLSSRAVLA